MLTEGQAALSEAMGDLSAVHGLVFSFNGKRFTAWPVQEMQSSGGKLTSSPDSSNLYEAASAPVFKIGDTLTGENRKSYTVAKLYPADSYTGKIRFAIMPGRPA